MRCCVVLGATLAVVLCAQSGPRNLNFEEGRPGDAPPGWSATKATAGYAFNRTSENPRAGAYCAEIHFIGAGQPSSFGSIVQSFDATPYRGKRVRFRAAVKLSPVDPEDHAQLWFRVDLSDKTIGFFDNMDSRPIRSPNWQYFDITGSVDNDAGRINLGLMVFGKGKAWIDDASVEILGEAPGTRTYVIPPSAAFDKLTEAAKLWVYVKYLHTRVTLPEVNWDQAFMDAAPKILDSRNDDDFAAALNAMLATLHDPFTRVDAAPAPVVAAANIRSSPEDVLLVGLTTPSDAQRSQQSLVTLTRELKSAKAVVFDLRGSRDPAFNSQIFALAIDDETPSTLKRVHYGFANQTSSGPQIYHSVWQIEDGGRASNPVSAWLRPVFLVNHETSIPPSAVPCQDSGACVVISEDAISDAQTPMGPPLTVGNLKVWVRVAEYQHPDGTSGFTANVVLNKTGAAALREAIEFARPGSWPAPVARTSFRRPPAVFTEKIDSRPYPITELRILAAARIWGVFHYFHPYKYLYGEDWDAVLAQFLPRLAAAQNAREYHLAVAEMVAHVHDSHCFVYSSALADARGSTRAGVEVRWIENQPVVTRITDPVLADSIHVGDVVTKVNGEPVRKRIDELAPGISASTPQALHWAVMSWLLNGSPNSESPLTLRGADGVERDVRVHHPAESARALLPHRSGEVYRLLSPKIGYVDLDRLTIPQVDAMFDAFKDTDAIVMDMRGYPHVTAWYIAPRLATSPGLVFALLRTNVVGARREGALRSELFEDRIPLADKPPYRGKTILLIDDRAGSQSEHSGLMYKTANGTVFIGSPTAGTNGDVTQFMAPGGITIPFSGHDVRWPDGKQLQRVGLIPDIEAHPTIEGIRAGRDEILERALTYIQTGH